MGGGGRGIGRKNGTTKKGLAEGTMELKSGIQKETWSSKVVTDNSFNPFQLLVLSYYVSSGYHLLAQSME